MPQIWLNASEGHCAVTALQICLLPVGSLERRLGRERKTESIVYDGEDSYQGQYYVEGRWKLVREGSDGQNGEKCGERYDGIHYRAVSEASKFS